MEIIEHLKNDSSSSKKLQKFLDDAANTVANIDSFVINNEKQLKYIICYEMKYDKKIILNMMISLNNKVIVDNVSDIALFKAELDLFNLDINSKYFESKSKKIENKVFYTLKLKNEELYLNKAEAKAIVELLRNLTHGCSYRELITYQEYQTFESWKEILSKNNFSK